MITMIPTTLMQQTNTTPSFTNFFYNGSFIKQVTEHYLNPTTQPTNSLVYDYKGVTQRRTREWFTLAQNNSVVKDARDVTLTFKCGRQEPTSEVGEKLYTRVKYGVITKVTGELANSVPFLFCRVRLVDDKTLEEILKNKKPVLAGITEAAITPTISQNKTGETEAREFEGSLKVQFMDVSYHHDRKEFALEVSYYLNDSLDTPVLVKLSPGFKVYARKQTQEKKKTSKKTSEKKTTSLSKKRKVSSDDDDDDNSGRVVKKQKKAENALSEFTAILDDLIDDKMRCLTPLERKNAIDLVVSTLFNQCQH
jgi:hypothetical protein